MTNVQAPAGPELAVAVAGAAASVLPAAEPLTPGTPSPECAVVPAGYAGAALADLDLPGVPRLAILVGPDLVEALAGSPLGGLDLAAAVQPAIDAAAAALGTTAQAAQGIGLDLVSGDLGGSFTVVPLLAGDTSPCAVLLADSLLAGPVAEESAAPVEAAGVFAALPDAAATPSPVSPITPRGIEMLHGVDMEVTVELGRTRMPVRELLALAPGTVLELDRAAGSPADLLVNGRLIARGEVVVIDEDFGLRVTEILDESAAS